MPFYDIQHSYPLEEKQKARLAQRITELHCSMFHTPSLFGAVTVNYIQHDTAKQNYYVAGECKDEGSNRIFALARTGGGRTREDFDKLATDIETAWYDVVGSTHVDDIYPTDRDPKKLYAFYFYVAITAREAGVRIPRVDEENSWLKSNMPLFKRRAEAGDQVFQDLLDEVSRREDLQRQL